VIPILLLVTLGGLMHIAASTPGLAGGAELGFGYLLLTAYFNGKLVSRIGLPKLTGYLIAGAVVGPHLLGLVKAEMTHELKMVGDAATAILALQAGAELQLSAVRPQLRTILALAFVTVVGTAAVLTGVLVALRPLVPFLHALPLTSAIAVAVALAVAMSAKSPAVVMALIGETRADGILTRTILATVVLADLSVIILYGIVSAAATAVIAGQSDVAGAIQGIAWAVFGSLGIGVVVGMALSRFLIHVGRGVGLFTLMICFTMAEIGAAVALDPLVILLAAGIYVRNVSRADTAILVDGLNSASLPVFLVFFALAGAKLDVRALATVAVPVGAIVATRALTFFAGTRWVLRDHEEPLIRRALWLGLLPQAGVALALATLVLRTFPAFGDAAFALIVGVVACNELVGPVILRLALIRSGEAGQRTTHDFAADH
jgi:Kef-type K+ transport system membrane component KefB